MGCLERAEFANNVILVASKMSSISISCLFPLNTRICVNSICLNITPVTRALGDLLIFSAPTMAKYLEICPFISTKALEYIMVLVIKVIKIHHWASQGVGGLVCVAWLWGGCVAQDLCSFGGECCLDFGTSFLGLGWICRDLRNLGIGVWFGFL